MILFLEQSFTKFGTLKMVRYVHQGDVFAIKGVNNYAHGCNCAGAMGKGIALQFKIKFPKMYEEYRTKCKRGEFKLGDVYVYDYGDGIVFNLATQLSWTQKASLIAIDNSITQMLNIASEMSLTDIALPKVGAGLGGLEWGAVRAIIEKCANKYPSIYLHVVENFLSK